MKHADDQSNRVALVIVPMPYGDIAFFADSNALLNHTPVSWTIVINTDDLRAAGRCFAFQSLKSRIARRSHKQARTVDPILLQVARRIQNRLLRPAADSGHDSCMKNKWCAHKILCLRRGLFVTIDSLPL